MNEASGIVKYVDSLRAVVAAREQSLSEGYTQATLDQILRSELGRGIGKTGVRLGKSGAAAGKAS